MAWTVWVVDTVTGVKRQRLPVSDFTWARALNAEGDGIATVQLNDSTVQKLNVKDLTTVLKNTLVIEWDGVVIYAGIIWERIYIPGTKILTLKHADLWSLLKRRLSVDRSDPLVVTTSQTYTGLSLATIAKRRLLLDRVGDAFDNRGLRITLPADIAGTNTRKYYGYHLDMLGDVLQDLINEGPDIDFAPRWADNELDHLFRAGTDSVPNLNVGRWEINLAAEQPTASNVVVSENAEKLATAIYAVGEGSEEDALIRSADVPFPPYPAVDLVQNYKKESDYDRLGVKAVADRAAFSKSTTQWSLDIRADGVPKVSQLSLGGTVAVYTEGDPWLADGWHNNRLTGFSGTLSNTVSLEFQPEGA